jgi:hypothetical protein
LRHGCANDFPSESSHPVHINTDHSDANHRGPVNAIPVNRCSNVVAVAGPDVASDHESHSTAIVDAIATTEHISAFSLSDSVTIACPDYRREPPRCMRAAVQRVGVFVILPRVGWS